MEPGTQIAYVPLHAKGDLADPDVEYGFVTSERGDVHFCRYWQRGSPGILRTVANSEATPTEMLVQHNRIPQDIVDQALKKIIEGGEA